MRNKFKTYVQRRVAFTLVGVAAASVMSCADRGAREEPEEGQEEAEVRSVDRIVLTKEALESLNLAYMQAEDLSLTPSLEVPAELTPDPDRRATVGPRVAGRVMEVRVVTGDTVARGETLLILESDAVGRARAELIAARARADVSRRAANRSRGLLEDRVTSKRAVEEAEGALQMAEAELRSVETRLATFGISPAEVTTDNPARVVLTSPIAGTVVGRSVHVGQWVEPTDTLIEVVDLAELWLLASVYEREMRYVQREQLVELDVRAYPGEVFKGTIAQVGDTLEIQTRSIPIRVVLPNPDRRLKPGMFATARIHGTHAHEPQRLLAIPWSAVQEVDGHQSVFVRIDEGVFVLRRVHTGERAGDYVEILNGLSIGDEVVAEGSFLLKGELLKATLGEEE
jgi:cobalt-zinc-cadmium efflux system membrane fusion protein